jgi:hypothetical protein
VPNAADSHKPLIARSKRSAAADLGRYLATYTKKIKLILEQAVTLSRKSGQKSQAGIGIFCFNVRQQLSSN